MVLGRVLGFELVTGGDGGVEHSWHCYGYAQAAQAARGELGIEVGELGLLRPYDEARAVLGWILAGFPDDWETDAWVVAVLADVG